MIVTAVYVYALAQGSFTFSFVQVLGTILADIIIASSLGGSQAMASTN